VAVVIARFQFEQFLEDHYFALVIFYLVFASIAVSMAKSIILFRRQQRGHGLYINAVRSQILGETGVKEDQYLQLLGEYRSFVNGRRVYLTKWIEFVVAVIATVTPLLFAVDALYLPLGFWLLIILLCWMIVLTLLSSCFVLWPWYKYNCGKKSLNWGTNQYNQQTKA